VPGRVGPAKFASWDGAREPKERGFFRSDRSSTLGVSFQTEVSLGVGINPERWIRFDPWIQDNHWGWRIVEEKAAFVCSVFDLSGAIGQGW